jgi:ketosteroid isomerase-like protein
MNSKGVWAAILAAIVIIMSLAVGAAGQGTTAERAEIEKTLRDSIGWALHKDRALLESVLAHDSRLFLFQPDSKSTIVGWDQFVKQFDFWMDPKFKATRFEVRELRIDVSRSGNVAWWSCLLDDLGEWDGKPIGWKDARWTGIMEKRGKRWLIVQMHFSLAADKVAAKTP